MVLEDFVHSLKGKHVILDLMQTDSSNTLEKCLADCGDL